jgi:hypothetical protein
MLSRRHILVRRLTLLSTQILLFSTGRILVTLDLCSFTWPTVFTMLHSKQPRTGKLLQWMRSKWRITNCSRYMGALTNNSRKLANFAGFYKGVQSAGAAVMWSLDNHKNISYMSLLAAVWGVLAGSLVFAFPLIWYKIRDHVPLEDDLKFSDETVADVLPQAGEISPDEKSPNVL